MSREQVHGEAGMRPAAIAAGRRHDGARHTSLVMEVGA